MKSINEKLFYKNFVCVKRKGCGKEVLCLIFSANTTEKMRESHECMSCAVAGKVFTSITECSVKIYTYTRNILPDRKKIATSLRYILFQKKLIHVHTRGSDGENIEKH